MFSVIISSKDTEKLYSLIIPSLYNIHRYVYEHKLPKIDIIVVNGEESLTKNYNIGIKKAKFKTKFFIHEDVDILDHDKIPLFVKIDKIFQNNHDFGLIGLVGTTERVKSWWWTCSRNSIKGGVKVPNNNNQEYWLWDQSQEFFEVALIDGFFMATNTNIEFSEDIVGFDLYDLDYCNLMAKNGLKVGVYNHLALHAAQYRDTSKVDFSHYHKKWFFENT